MVSLCLPYSVLLCPYYSPLMSASILSHAFPLMSVLFPHDVPCICLVFPYTLSHLFPHYFPISSLLFPYVWLIFPDDVPIIFAVMSIWIAYDSPIFSVVFVVSLKCPYFFPWLPYYFLIMSLLFPYCFPNIFPHIFPHSFQILRDSFSGWWLGHPSEKYEFVNWDDYSIPNINGKSQKMATKPPASFGISPIFPQDLHLKSSLQSPSEVENPPRAARESGAPPASPHVEHLPFGSRPPRRRGSKPQEHQWMWLMVI